MLGISGRDAQFLEVEVIRESLRINREHRAHQASLKSAMLLSKLTEPCAQVGVKMDVAATYDLANVLWDHGEMTTSIRMLQPLVDQPDIQAQTVPINRPEILANLVRCEAPACKVMKLILLFQGSPYRRGKTRKA
jgi:ataxia telangiectasia mutated family protein